MLHTRGLSQLCNVCAHPPPPDSLMQSCRDYGVMVTDRLRGLPGRLHGTLKVVKMLYRYRANREPAKPRSDSPLNLRALYAVQRLCQSPPESAIFFAFSGSFASTTLRSSRRLENTNLPQTREKLGILFALIFRISVSHIYLPCTAARSNQPSEDSHEPRRLGMT